MAQIGLHGMDLADAAQWLQKAGEFWPSHRHPNPIVTFGKGSHDVTAKKARSAIDGNQGVIGAACGHAALDSMPAGMPRDPADTR